MSDDDDVTWYRVTLHAAQLVRVEVAVRATSAEVARIVAEQERDGIMPGDWKTVGEPGPLRAVDVRRVKGNDEGRQA